MFLFFFGSVAIVGLFAALLGRSGAAWTLMTLLVGFVPQALHPLGGIGVAVVMLVLLALSGRYKESAVATKTCPHCAEKILPEAKICKHCKSDLTAITKLSFPSAKKGPRERVPMTPAYRYGLLLALLAIAGAMIANFPRSQSAFRSAADFRQYLEQNRQEAANPALDDARSQYAREMEAMGAGIQKQEAEAEQRNFPEGFSSYEDYLKWSRNNAKSKR